MTNKEGEKVKRFEGQFINPWGVAFSTDGHILVTDTHRLQKLTTEGVCVKSVGSSEGGSGQLQFNYPTGITVHPITGEIYVADSGNKRVQVFTNDLAFSHTITPSGLFKQFKLPHDVALDNEGYLYVLESGNLCITKVTTNGKFIKRFGSDQLNRTKPSSLTVNDSFVYVCDEFQHCILVFNINDGTFLHWFGEFGELEIPRGIAIDTFGNMYVSDSDNNRIVVY